MSPLDNNEIDKKSTRNSIVKEAKKLLNSRYKSGGTDPRGFDCSGFTYYVYNKSGEVKLSRTSRSQASQGKKISLDEVQKGDLLFFKRGERINHVGIIVKKTKSQLWMIHASSSRGVIMQDVLQSPYWRPRIAFAKSVL